MSRLRKDSEANSPKTYYERLQVPPNALPKYIHMQFRRLAGKDHWPSNPEEVVKLNDLFLAYHVLIDPVRRANYDQSLAEKLSDENVVRILKVDAKKITGYSGPLVETVTSNVITTVQSKPIILTFNDIEGIVELSRNQVIASRKQ
jgi:curved DNA-binding protein CbpA